MRGVARARYSVCRARTVSGVGEHVTRRRFRVGSKKAWWSFVSLSVVLKGVSSDKITKIQKAV
jgi:hypothetical protein